MIIWVSPVLTKRVYFLFSGVTRSAMFGISEINTDSKVACLYFLFAELWYVVCLVTDRTEEIAQNCCGLFSDSPSSSLSSNIWIQNPPC